MGVIEQNDRSALVLFSGGQDSTTCLAWALERFTRVDTIGFDYGQRHTIEMIQRAEIRQKLAVNPVWRSRLGEDLVLRLNVIQEIAGSALTEDRVIEMGVNGLPTTFVPGRNLLFLTYAAVVAYRRGLKHVITGVCETDYSGYPDCRDDTIKALQATLNLGMEARFVLHTPLMWRDKAATWALAQAIGGDDLVEMIRTDTHTCYEGDRSVLHAWGYGCGRCPACQLRRVGYETFQATAA